MLRYIFFLFIIILFNAEDTFARQLKVAMGSSLNPMHFRDSKDKMKGFEVDLIELFAEQKGFEIVYLDPAVHGKSSLNMVIEGIADIALNTITITDERKKLVKFSEPYFISGAALLMKKYDSNSRYGSNYKSFDFSNITYLIKRGSPYLSPPEGIRYSNMRLVDNSQEAIKYIENELIGDDLPYVYIYDWLWLNKFAMNRSDLEVSTFIISKEDYGLATKDETLLIDWNSFFNEIKKTKQFSSIGKKWFPNTKFPHLLVLKDNNSRKAEKDASRSLPKVSIEKLFEIVSKSKGMEEFEAVLALAETKDVAIHNKVVNILGQKYRGVKSTFSDAFRSIRLYGIISGTKMILQTSSKPPYEPLGTELLALCAFSDSKAIRDKVFWIISTKRDGHPNAKRLLLRMLELKHHTTQVLYTLRDFKNDKEVVDYIVKNFDKKEYPEWLDTPLLRQTYRKNKKDELYIKDSILYKYTALEKSHITHLDDALLAMKNQKWKRAEVALLNLLKKEPNSLDAVFLLMLSKKYQEIEEVLTKNLYGNKKTFLCESVATTNKVPCYTDATMNNSSKTISLSGEWGNAGGSGDRYYKLDKVQIYAQTPNSVFINASGSKSCWLKKSDIYYSRFVIEEAKTNYPVFNVGCFPLYPFTFDYNPMAYKVRFTFYPNYFSLIQGAKDHLYGSEKYGYLYDLRDAVSTGGMLNLKMFYPKMSEIPWGIEVSLDLKTYEFTREKRENPVNAKKAFSGTDSDYSIPVRDACGSYPHGPYKMKLCFHKNLTYSGDGKYRAFISEPHDNTY